MGTINSDYAWKKLGKENAYYGVLSDEKYRNNNLSESNYSDFFETGQKYVDEVFEEIRQLTDKNFFPGKMLDFGCGTGRLVIPFSKKTCEIVGMDISEDMLSEAKKNCSNSGVNNARFVISDDGLTELKDEKFDLINTYIVLQHINVSRGEKIIQILLNKLNTNGIGVIHFVFGRETSASRKFVNYLRCRVPYFHNFLNLVQGKPFKEPLMQMNNYDINKIFRMLYRSNVETMKIKLTNHSGHLGAILLFQRAAAGSR